MLCEPGILPRPRQPGHQGDKASEVLMRNVMQAAELVTVKQKARMIISKSEWTVKAAALLGHHFPQVKIVLGPAHFFCLAAPSVGERKEIEQAIIDHPGK